MNGAGQRVIQKTEKTATATHRQLLAAGATEAPRRPNYPLLVLLAFIPLATFAMVYGPLAAFLVDAFPAAVRYISPASFEAPLGRPVAAGAPSCCAQPLKASATTSRSVIETPSGSGQTLTRARAHSRANRSPRYRASPAISCIASAGAISPCPKRFLSGSTP